MINILAWSDIYDKFGITVDSQKGKYITVHLQILTTSGNMNVVTTFQPPVIVHAPRNKKLCCTKEVGVQLAQW